MVLLGPLPPGKPKPTLPVFSWIARLASRSAS